MTNIFVNMLRCRQVLRQLQVPFQQRASSTGNNPTGGNENHDPEDKHPIRRTFRLLANDMRKVKEFFVPQDHKYEDNPQSVVTNSKFKFSGQQGQTAEFQTHCDVLVVGGGGIGSATAYWLKQKARDGLNVVVVEKDETYAKSATHASVGALCQQFSLPENIEMSLFGADFMRNAQEHFGTDIPLNYTPHGHLVLADEADAEQLGQTSLLQNELGARNELLTADRLATRFPWLNTKGVALGCLGMEREGWYDSWALLTNLRRAASGYGAHFVHGEVTDFVFQKQEDIMITGHNPNKQSSEGSYQSLDKVVVRLADGAERTIKFALCVIAAGIQSGEVARLAHIGRSTGMLRVPLPIDARKRYAYVINSQDQNAPGMSMPMVVDTSGNFLRRDGLAGQYVCSRNAEEPAAGAAEPLNDLAYFESNIRPALVERVPAFKTATVVSGSAGYYDYNVYDENGILGPHPYYHNLYIASGFSAQGMQQAPAVGRAISELIMDGHFRTLDLSRLSFDRLIVDKPMYEFNALN